MLTACEGSCRLQHARVRARRSGGQRTHASASSVVGTFIPASLAPPPHGERRRCVAAACVSDTQLRRATDEAMSWLFGARKTPADLLRENKRMLDKAIRELDRERTGLQAQEKKLIAEIKRVAKQNQMAAVRLMAKDLIRTRNSVTKFYALKSQLQGVSLRMQTLKSTQAMADAMRCACRGCRNLGTRGCPAR